MANRFKGVLKELKEHSPFTILGALLGIVFMFIFRNIGQAGSHTLFSIFHPAHVVLSAMITASLFRLHEHARSFLIVLVVGYIGAIGVATLSDSIMPFFGETILGVVVPTHGHTHEHEAGKIDEHENHTHDAHEHEQHEHHDHETADQAEHTSSKSVRERLYLGFIEEWYLVNPAAILGVLIAYFLPMTKFPHAAHVLISTWASSAHILMNTETSFTGLMFIGFFIVLFISVWVPCCVSDIVFPMLLVKSKHDD